ncbi:Malonyl CoA-acyl carrier protein transacylase [Rhodopirellula islandica]|uniref:Malonyl CoA-acyl carrier protein transacylase n=1 Tax=Rhodopirellula islandica TaxID=595434 RepID=A0A0J1BJ36_RHOIS|nr:type I polyketide synthase [Rhodopirellula islandica]KLU06571.1 Malonyl CoA-acyl carrier protein transacylase [Rhodopirellula islandica]
MNSPERDLSERLAKLSPEQRAALRKRLARSSSSTPSPATNSAGSRPSTATAEPIAIVGVSCRFPGAPDLDAYWKVISEGIDATAEIPPERWDVDSLYDPTGQKAGRMSVRRAGMVANIDQFDPKFFGISPREAARMDPQQRLLLEVSWEAFEIAGIPVSSLAGTPVGAYVGIGGTDYSKVPSTYDGYYQYIDAHVGTGNALSIAANRLSYIMDLRGPSMAIDTACSSSTMAIHLAVQSLRSGECDAALAGGVNAILTPETTIAFSKARMLSPDGQCRPFDADANGYVRGEGCGMLLLKRLRDAERDGDHIWGTILASATNQDGRTSGITAPNGVSQQAVIRTALREAGLPASRVNYIEAHGTGTPLGDPIEVDALTQVFSGTPGVDPPCYVTSVKANVGHMETVSGVAGIIKLLLMMRHQTIPGQLHLKKLNPRMSLKRSRIVIPAQSPPWPVDDEPLIAGVSSFGFGGANTHLLMQQYLPKETVEVAGSNESQTKERTRHVLALSGKSEAAIAEVASRLKQHLERNDDNIVDVAHTMNVGRVHHTHRSTVVFEDSKQLGQQLTQLSEGKKGPGIRSGQTVTSRATRIAFLFTGQGSQSPGMGKGLFETQPVFRKAMLQCDEILSEVLPKRLLDVLYGEGPDSDLVHQTRYTQPALFAIEYSLAKLWLSWGVKPQVVLGHSVGEFAAACIAGVVSLDDALSLIAHRGRLMGELAAGGGMTAMFESAEVIAKQLGEFQTSGSGTLSIAAENGPQNTVVSGPLSDLDAFAKHCEEAGIASKALQVSHAFHSQLMEPMLDEFRKIAEQCEFKAPRIPLISNLTGEQLTKAWDADYLCDHIRNAVRFQPSMQALSEMDIDVMLEVGPSPILTGMGKRCLPESNAIWTPSLRSGNDDETVLYEAVGDVHARGGKVDWRAFDQPWQRRRLVLPTYPFDRQRYWLDPSDDIVEDPSRSRSGAGEFLHPMLGRLQPSALQSRLYENALSARSPEFLADHAVQGSVNLPGAAFMEVAFAAARDRFGAGSHAITDANIEHAMFVSEDRWKTFQTIVDESLSLEVFSRDRVDAREPWQRHMSASLVPAEQSDESTEVEVVLPPPGMSTVAQRFVGGKGHDEFYDLMSHRRLEYGPRFRMLHRVDYSIDEALGQIQCDDTTRAEFDDYILHPVLGDALMQTFSALVPRPDHDTFSEATYMPTKVSRAVVHQRPSGTLRTYGRRTSAGEVLDPEFVEGDVWLVNERDEVVAEWTGVRVTRVGRVGGGASESLDDSLYQIDWQDAESSPVVPAEVDLDGQQVWLLGGGGSLRDSVAKQLVGLGAQVVTGELECDLKSLAAREESTKPLAAIITLWDSSEASSDPAGDAEVACQEALTQVRSAIEHVTPGKHFRGWWHVTKGAQTVSASETNIDLAHAPVWGMIRVAMMELADLKPRLLDLDPSATDQSNASAVMAETVAENEEDHVAYRGGKRYLARLVKRHAQDGAGGETTITIPSQPHRLRFRQTGSFDSLYFEPMEREAPQGSEVELRVNAAGLNFSDVLKVMGLYPGITDKVVPLGIECAGVVTAVGEDAKRFQVGDRVMGVAPFSFGSHAKTPEYTLVKRPAGIDDVEAATIPIAFLTAWYGLVHLADVQPGERVLIHAGAGGVGLAATQIAQYLGAEVIATAGSDEKRDFLRGCGVKHVFNSRTTAFADDIRRAFGGQGVDVVLNSLPGEAIPKSLGVLNAYGRFLEIGKTDIYQDRKVGLLPFQDNLSYHAIDLDRVLRQRPAKIEKLWSELAERFEAGDLQPIACTEFDQTEMVETFRYMAQRKNIGKVITRMSTQSTMDSTAETEAKDESAASTVLITGGTGAIGLKLAKRLIDEGATSIALLSRRQPTGEVAAKIDALTEESDDANVIVLQGDVGDLESLRSALKQLPDGMPPIAHVYHAAGVLQDGLLMDMTAEQLLVPMGPKVQGGWNLHLATKDFPIESFVLFSSIAACLGSPGQANYAAANSFLDALAEYRRGKGLPATSIAWGPWAESGMAATEDRSSQLESRGMHLLPAEACLQTMQELIEAGDHYVAVMDVDWPAMTNSMRRTRPFFTEFADSSLADSNSKVDQVDHEFRARLAGIPEDERTDQLRHYFASELARLMGWEAEQIDVTQKLSELGMDSLIAMELKNNLEQRLAITIPMSALVESPSINSLVGHVVSQFADEDGGMKAASGKPTRNANDRTALIVPLKAEGSRSPWLCIHPLGGSTACYSDFSQQVDDDQPVHALAGGGSDGVSEPPATLDAMMDEYVDLVQEQFADEELRLIGWSAGGVFALELARRLEKRGRDDVSVTLLDTPLPSIYRNVDPNDDVQFVADLIQFSNAFSGTNMRLTAEELEGARGTDKIWQLVLEEAQRAGVLSQSASAEMVRKLIDTSRRHVQFIKSYEIDPASPSVQLILPVKTTALEGSSGERWTDHLDWASQLDTEVIVEQTDGDHFTMLMGEQARELAKRMEQHATAK